MKMPSVCQRGRGLVGVAIILSLASLFFTLFSVGRITMVGKTIRGQLVQDRLPKMNKNLMALMRELKEKEKDEQADYQFGQNATLKYVKTGYDINCSQKPLSSLEYEGDLKPVLQLKNKKFAYVFYAANWEYLCSALALLKLLKTMRASSDGQLNVDYVLTYVKDDFRSKKALGTLDKWVEWGGKLRNFTSLRKKSHVRGYYEGVLQKFHSFLLTEYSRVVMMDSDGLPLCGMDHLFRLKFPPGVHLAAPQGYWYLNQGIIHGYPACPAKNPMPYVTTALMVIEPSEDLYSSAEKHFGSFRPRLENDRALGFKTSGNSGKQLPNFDGDIVNIEFACKDTLLILPKHYATLSPEFKHNDGLAKRFEKCKDLANVCYLHFSGGPKPWSGASRRSWLGSKDTYPKDLVAAMNEWFKAAHDACPSLVP